MAIHDGDLGFLAAAVMPDPCQMHQDRLAHRAQAHHDHMHAFPLRSGDGRIGWERLNQAARHQLRFIEDPYAWQDCRVEVVLHLEIAPHRQGLNHALDFQARVADGRRHRGVGQGNVLRMQIAHGDEGTRASYARAFEKLCRRQAVGHHAHAGLPQPTALTFVDIGHGEYDRVVGSHRQGQIQGQSFFVHAVGRGRIARIGAPRDDDHVRAHQPAR